MKTPERSPWWWFWRAFGLFVYGPARTALRKYLRRNWVKGQWLYSWPGAQALCEWIDRRATKGPRAFWLRALLHWVMTDHPYSQCLHCGWTEYDEEHTLYGRDGEELRTINLFEHVEGGGVDYWGEGQDAYGWQWCYRCGAVGWEAA